MRIRDYALVVLGATSIGCDRLPECSTLPQPPRVRACMVKDGETQVLGALSYSVSATVTAVGPARSGGCLPADEDTLSVSKITALTLQGTDGASYDLEYLSPPGSGPVWATGDLVHVDYSFHFGGWSPTTSDLSVMRAGHLELYYGEGGGVDDLTSSPMPLAEGGARCESHDECGSWRYYDLRVTASSGPVEVPVGKSLAVGEYSVIHGGIGGSISAHTQCNDWGVAFAHVAVLRRPAP